jgi:hypothetical protein
MEEILRQLGKHLGSWPKLGWSDARHGEAIVSLYLLEEMELRFLVISTLTTESVGQGFQLYCQEAQMISGHFRSRKV